MPHTQSLATTCGLRTKETLHYFYKLRSESESCFFEFSLEESCPELKLIFLLNYTIARSFKKKKKENLNIYETKPVYVY